MNNKPKILFFILTVVAIFLISKFVANPIKNTFHLIFARAENTFFQTTETAHSFFGSLLNTKQIESQNQQLLKEHFILTQENNALQMIKQENIVLRRVLGISEARDFEFIMSEVVARQIISDMVLINSGERHGSQKGMVVITTEHILVGEIATVFQDFAQVVLISNNNNSFDVEIQNNEQSILGVAKGIGGLQMTYGLAPKDEVIKTGDKIFTTSLGGNFPEGLLVGEVLEVKRTDAAPYQTGVIAPYFHRIPLSNVLIIKNFTPINY